MIYAQKNVDADGAYIAEDGTRWNVRVVRNIRPLTSQWKAFNDAESALSYWRLKLAE